MTRRLIAIAFIFAVTSVAWVALGATLHERTSNADSRLRDRVGSTWGTAQTQLAPVAYVEREEIADAATAAAAAREQRARRQVVPPAPATTATTDIVAAPQLIRVRDPLALERTRARVAFDLDHRKKGLLWYSTYAVTFNGSYRFRNTTSMDAVTLELPLPTAQAIYDDLRLTVDGKPVDAVTQGQSLVAAAKVAPGATVDLEVGYRSQGLDEWRYALGANVSTVRDFELTMRTDFGDIDFPGNALSPTTRVETAEGWDLTWRYANLMSGFQIGMLMPQKLQPGPVAGRISLFAPVSLLFFFAAMFLIVTIRGIDLHPMNYAFLAAGFFAFHLLMAYLVDHISIHLAFVLASAVSLALVVSYLRLVIGPRFAFVEAGLAQLLYLVLFSYAFFFEGFTGLAITVGSIVTLFVAMQLTGRVRWTETFERSAPERVLAPGGRV
jgi:hypothetical protein